MENNKVLSISINGADKVLKSTEQIQQELKNADLILKKMGIPNASIKDVEKFNKELSKIVNIAKLSEKEINDLAKSLKSLSINNSLDKIDKSIKFPETKKAVKEITSSLVQLGSVAIAEGKSAKDAVTEIGNSVAAIAFNLGPYGVAVGAAITVLTPLIASFFELSDAEKEAARQAGIYKEDLLNLTDAFIDATNEAESFQDQLQKATNNANLEKRSEILKKLTPALIELAKVERMVADAAQRGDVEDESRYTVRLNNQKAKIQLIKDEALIQQKVNEDFLAASDKIQAAQEEINKSLMVFDPEADAEKKEKANNRIRKSNEDTERNRREALNKKEQQERKVQDELEQGLKDINDELDKEIRKLQELSRIGSLNEIAKQQQKVLDLQQKQNTAIDDAVRKTRNYTNVTKELQDARNNVANRNKNNTLTADLSNAEAKIDQLRLEQTNGIQEIFNVLNTNLTSVWLNADKRNQEILKEINQSALGTSSGKSTLNLINSGTSGLNNIDAVKKRLQELRNNFGDTQDFIDAAISEGFQLPLYDAYTNLINKTKTKIDDYKAQIQATQSKANNAVNQSLTAIQERFKQSGIAASEAFYAALNYTDEKLAQAGLKTMQDQIEKLIANRNIDVSDLLGDAMNSVKDFNKLFEDNFGKSVAKVEDEILKLDEYLINQQRSLLTGDDLTSFENILASIRRSFDVHNRQVQATNVLFRIDELNAISDFNDEWIKYYEERNRFEIREQKLQVDELSFLNKDYFDSAIDMLEQHREQRVKSNKKMSKEELDEIRRNKEASLSILEQQQREELELFDKSTTENINALIQKHQSEKNISEEQAKEMTNVQIREVELARKQLITNQKETYKQQGDAFDKFSEEFKKKQKEGEPDPNDWLEDFLNIFNQANELAQVLVDIAITQQENLISRLQDNLSRFDQQISESASRLSDLESDLEGKQSGRRDAVLRGIELEKQRQAELAAQKIKLEQQIAKEEKKLANQRKAAAITQAVINGALSITNILANTVDPTGVYKAILIGISAATTAAQIGLISQQKFAKGGFTGNGGQKDETGHRVAGVVHNDEWVAPKWMVESPRFSNTINQLEQSRQRGFAEGGFTTPDFNGMNQSLSNQGMMNMLERYATASLQLANRPIYANVTEFNNVSANKARRMQANTI